MKSQFTRFTRYNWVLKLSNWVVRVVKRLFKGKVEVDGKTLGKAEEVNQKYPN